MAKVRNWRKYVHTSGISRPYARNVKLAVADRQHCLSDTIVWCWKEVGSDQQLWLLNSMQCIVNVPWMTFSYTCFSNTWAPLSRGIHSADTLTLQTLTLITNDTQPNKGSYGWSCSTANKVALDVVTNIAIASIAVAIVVVPSIVVPSIPCACMRRQIAYTSIWTMC